MQGTSSKVLIAGLAFVVLIFAAINGCSESDVQPTLPNPILVADASGSTDLEQGLDFLNRLDEFDDQNQVRQRIRNHMQRWLAQQTVDPAWSADPLALQLAGRFNGMMTAEWLGKNEFDPADLFMMQEAIWMRDVALGVTRSNVPAPDIAALRSDDSKLPPEVQQVALLFDWVVRNLQLDRDVIAGDIHRLNSDLKLYPWESLLMGRGTAAEKSRVLTLLARQLGHSVVMLGVDRSGTAIPWLPALVFDGQVYLFDMRLGVPVPGPNGQGIATLDDVIATPTILSQLALGDSPYRISEADVKKTVALIDVSPAYLSRRMQVLESELLRDQKTVLSINLTAAAEQVASCKGITNVGFWQLSYETFRNRETLSPGSPGMSSLMYEHSLFNYWTALRPARLLHLRAAYSSPENSEKPGATMLYLSSRRKTPGDDRMEQDLMVQLNANAETAAASEEERAAYVSQISEQLRLRIGDNSSHWLGLMKFDQGDYKVAIDYQRPLAEQDGMWQVSAAYNLGRAWECIAFSMSEEAAAEARENAIAAYRTIFESPMGSAAQLRVQRLTPSEPQPEADSESEAPVAEEESAVSDDENSADGTATPVPEDETAQEDDDVAPNTLESAA